MQGDKPTVIFVLGGPGSGKGTQCQLFEKNHNFHHLSAGDLLRAQRKKQGSENGALIQKYIDQGKIVPSKITIALLEQAMREKGWENGRYLIDGFPRNQENLNMWNTMLGEKVNTPFILFFDCSEDTMLKRCLKRGELTKRTDDCEEILRKRFNTFKQETMFVVNYFKNLNKLARIETERGIKQIEEEITQTLYAKGVLKK